MLVRTEKRFFPDPRSAAAARAFVSEHLRGMEVDLPAVVLLTSELVTNAVLHARTEFLVRVRCRPLPIRIEVEDLSTALPVIPGPQSDSTSGRGILIVDKMALCWGVDPLPSGKRVWFEYESDGS